MRLLKLAMAVAALSSGFAVWVYLYTGRVDFFGALASQDDLLSWKIVLLGYAATVAGVVAGSGYRTITRGDESPSGPIPGVARMFGEILNSRDLWAGLFASPMVFGLLFKTTEGISDSGLFVMALENGFFCHFVINQLVNSQQGASAEG